MKQSKRVFLSLERLETRELLSATSFAGYSLVNGTLYHDTSTGQVQIDTGVQDFKVVNSIVYDLHGDETLTSLNPDGSGKQILDTSVVNFDVNSAGDWFALEANNTLREGGGATVSAAAQKFTLAPDGAVYFLGASTSGDALYHWTSAGGNTLVYDGTGNYQIAPDSSVYFLGGDTDSNVLYRWDVGAGSSSVGMNTSSFALAPNGTLYFLTTGASGGWLEMQGPDAATRKLIGTNVKVFGLDGTGAVVALDSNGSLQLFAPGSFTMQVMASGVSTFLVDAAGSVVAFEPEAGTNLGTVVTFAPGSTQPLPSLASNVSHLAEDGSGQVYFLESNGNLYQAGGSLVKSNVFD